MILGFMLKDDQELLKASFQSQNAGKAQQDIICIGCHALYIPQFFSYLSLQYHVFLLTDYSNHFMEGTIGFFWNDLIFRSYMLSTVKAHFEDFINRIEWPSHIGRLPKNVSDCHLYSSVNCYRKAAW
jgi:hypothetical protein